jgi:hypothetical protein
MAGRSMNVNVSRVDHAFGSRFRAYHRPMSGKLIRLFAGTSAIEGELTKAHLETEGIPVMLTGEGTGTYRTGPAYVWVPEEREAEARALLDAISKGEFDTAADEGFDAEADDPVDR